MAPETGKPIEQHVTLRIAGENAMRALGQRLAGTMSPGDTLCLDGPIGAGKSTLARAFIASRLAEENRVEDIPSPTFTLVQTYELAAVEIWHTDLYRLSHADELIELGLFDAFETAIVLIEWPGRLGHLRPERRIECAISVVEDGNARDVTFRFVGDGWTAALSAIAS